MKININAQTGKTYAKEVDKNEQKFFIGKRIGQTIKLDRVGLEGYEAVITGGSDKQGFPLRKSMQGTKRRKALLKGGVGYKKAKHGIKKRKSVKGNQIDEEVQQVNLRVVKKGKTKLEKVFKKPEKQESDKK